MAVARMPAPTLATRGGEDAGDLDGGEDAGDLDGGAHAGDLDGGEDAGDLDAGADAGPGVDAGAGCALASGVGAPFVVRVVAANLSSGNLQSWDPGEGQRILQGLRPDVVLIQEFNDGTNSVADLDAFVESTFPDAGFSYTRGNGSIPNGVLSRWPILASGQWTDPRVGNRTFVWARLDLPGPRDLWVVSVHLLTTSAGERNLEAQELLAQLDAGVPPGDLLAVGGDFNTEVRSEVCLSTLQPRARELSPYPADQQGVEGTNTSRAKPYDHVLASPCLDLGEVPVTLGDAGVPAGLVFDSRVYSPLTDVPPVLSTDSAATNMQHMAVVRDFSVQP